MYDNSETQFLCVLRTLPVDGRRVGVLVGGAFEFGSDDPGSIPSLCVILCFLPGRIWNSTFNEKGR